MQLTYDNTKVWWAKHIFVTQWFVHMSGTFQSLSRLTSQLCVQWQLPVKNIVFCIHFAKSSISIWMTALSIPLLKRAVNTASFGEDMNMNTLNSNKHTLILPPPYTVIKENELFSRLCSSRCCFLFVRSMSQYDFFFFRHPRMFWNWMFFPQCPLCLFFFFFFHFCLVLL